MATLEMNGPFDLTPRSVNQEIPAAARGNYALGRMNGLKFIVMYVGRSDTCLNTRLKHWEGEYPKFKYSIASSAREAFEKECRNYHDFGETSILDNEVHPDRHDGHTWRCPVCKIFG